MDTQIKIIEVTPDNVEQYGFCTLYKNPKNERYQKKLEWFVNCSKQGLKYKVIYSLNDEVTMGIIEYVPGAYSWRSVDAENYMVIHCILVPKRFSRKGYGSLLINECVKDAKKFEMDGVVTLATKNPWCANDTIYLNNGFIAIDQTVFGFKLLVKQLKDAKMPSFGNLEEKSRKYESGIYMLYSDQCPFMAGGTSFYNKKDTLKSVYGIEATVIKLKDCKEAQMNPCVWGTYGMIANGKVISYITGGNSYIKILEKMNIIEKRADR